MTLFARTSNFDRFLGMSTTDKATSHMLLEPDWTAILQICDCIRQGDVQPKYAFNAIKKKMYAQNPHVALYSLQVLESCVKNCGTAMHQEVTTRQFMEELRDLAKATPHDTVKNKILELIQAWAHAFRNEPNYRAVQDTVNLMKMEGFKFPVLKESDAMFLADQAPDWADGDCCHRCRVQFSVVQRKHHCRNCGQIFCNRCSARSSPIPKFGIERDVRVCEACWEKLNKPSAQKTSAPGSEQSSPYLAQNSTKGGGSAGGKSEQELQEEEDLQLALALSKSEADNKDKPRSSSLSNTSKPTSPMYSSTVSPHDTVVPDSGVKKENMSGLDSELAHYLNRSYWEQKQQQQDDVPQNRVSPVPSAPATLQNHYSPTKISENLQNGETQEMEAFLSNLRTTLEIFVNRMKSNFSRGRPIANDTYVQSLFMSITNMHSQLIKYIQEQDDCRVHFESLQDKLNQARDARAALDSLREEHRERLRREAEEAERIRQIQMAQKLEIMRKKKQEYLQYQRQLAMHRMQEQEREMQLRQEQQKQQYIMQAAYPSQGPYITPGQMYSLPPQPPGPPMGPVPGSPHHMPYQGQPGFPPPGEFPPYMQALPHGSQAPNQFSQGPPVTATAAAPPQQPQAPQVMGPSGPPMSGPPVMQQPVTTHGQMGPPPPHPEAPPQHITEPALISFD